MRALWFVVTVALVILAAHVGYDRGQREMRLFEALCETPGVECVVRFDPAYLEQHSGSVQIPEPVGAEFAGLAERAR